MADYQVKVAAQGSGIVLRVAGDLDDQAGRHVLELARLVVHGLQKTAYVDIAGARSVTPGAAKLLSRHILHRLGTSTRLRTREGFDHEPQARDRATGGDGDASRGPTRV